MDRTNETASGYTYNGQNYTNQTKVDSQGNNYTVSVPTAISASSLATPSAPIAVTQPNYNTSGMSNQAAQAGAYINNGALTAQQQAEQIAKQNEINLTNEKNYLNTTLGSLQSSVGGKGADLLNAYNQQDASGNSVNSLAAKLRGYSAQSQALGLDNLAKTQQEINNATGQNITQSAVNRNTADATRNNLIQQASIAMQSAIVSADYESAKSYADQMINAKYDQKLADIEAAKTNIANIQDQLTSAEKKTAQATLERLNNDKQVYDEKIANEKEISNLIIDATPNAPASVIANARKIAEKGGSKIEVAQALGVYGGDFLKNELLKEQINNIKADTAKVRSETVKIDTNNSLLSQDNKGIVTAPNGDEIGLPADVLSIIGKQKLNESQSNAVAFVSRMIQSDKAINSQIGQVAGGFYESTGYDPTSVGSSFGRFVGSDNSREYERNAEDFIRAQLRKESGASIAPDELTGAKKLYVASGAGQDEKDIIEAKKKREGAIKSMIAQAGPAAPYLQEYYEQSKTQGDAFVSANPQLNSWYQNTTVAVQTSTLQASSASSYGFVDNQK